VAERWLAAVQSASQTATDLAVGELLLAIGKQQYRRGAAVGDRLADAGRRDPLCRASGQVACMLAWCYWHVGRLSDARAVVEASGPGPEQLVMRYLLSLCSDDVAAPADQGPPLTGGPLDALTIRLHWAHGRLEELRHEPASRWAAAVADPMRISALLAIGETEEAAQISGRSGPPAAPQAWLEVMATVELLAELGRDREASEQLAAGHALIEPTGSIVLEMLSQVLEARLALAAGDLRGAYAVLDELEGDGTPRRYRFIAELADTWRGLAALKSGDD
jgi:hypothetical protein